MPMKPLRKLRIHDYGNYCTFTSRSESFFVGMRVYGRGHGPFEYEVFEGGSRFLGEGSKNPLRYFPRTSDEAEARNLMRATILERAGKVAIKDGIGLDTRVVQHD